MSRSNSFINFVSLISVAVSILAIIGMVLNIIMGWNAKMVDNHSFYSTVQSAISEGSLPAHTGYLLLHIKELSIVGLVYFILLLVAAIGVYKRSFLAYNVYLYLVGLFGIAISIMYFFQLKTIYDLESIMQPPASFAILIIFSVLMSSIIWIGLMILFGLLIKKMRSVEVRSEFK